MVICFLSFSSCNEIDQLFCSRLNLEPVAWGSLDDPAPRLRPPPVRTRCDIEPVGCPDPPGHGSSFSSGMRSCRPCPPSCMPLSWPGFLCTWAARSSPTSWRWPSRSRRWLSGTDLKQPRLGLELNKRLMLNGHAVVAASSSIVHILGFCDTRTTITTSTMSSTKRKS